jgi:hypothetical protein
VEDAVDANASLLEALESDGNLTGILTRRRTFRERVITYEPEFQPQVIM